MSGPAKPVNWYALARGLRAAGVTLTDYGRQLAASPQQFRRICCACQKDMGPAIGNYSNDTHGVCDPMCAEGLALGYDT